MVKDLIAAGFTEQQAEAQVSTLSRFITYNLATKADVAKIERDIEALRKDLKTDIEALRKETKMDIAEVNRDIAELRKETMTGIEMLRRDLTIRMGGIMVAGVGIVLGILALIITRLPA